MGVFSGWVSGVSSAAQIVASLAGQTVSMLKLTLTQVTGQVALQMTDGARLKLGTGTTDYLESNGATLITAAGNFTVAGALTSNGAFQVADNTSRMSGASATLWFSNAAATAGNFESAMSAANMSASNPAFTFFCDNAPDAGDAILGVFGGAAGATGQVFGVTGEGKIINNTAGDSTGTPGNATLNTPTGRSAFAAGAATVTITNSLVSATSIVLAVLQTADGTLTTLLRVVPGAGTFTITGNGNATATTNVGWIVFNI